MKLEFDNFRIRTLDSLNLVVEEYRDDKKGGKFWKTLGYFGRLEYALNRLLELKINRSHTESLVDLKNFVHDVKTNVFEEVRKLRKD